MDNSTYSKYYTYFKCAISESLTSDRRNVRQIGGPGLIVEVDESMFGKL